jgi:hypothetical protein
VTFTVVAVVAGSVAAATARTAAVVVRTIVAARGLVAASAGTPAAYAGVAVATAAVCVSVAAKGAACAGVPLATAVAWVLGLVQRAAMRKSTRPCAWLMQGETLWTQMNVRFCFFVDYGVVKVSAGITGSTAIR